MINIAEYFDITKYLDFKNPMHFYGFLAVIIWLVYALHADLGIIE